jgi:hypothetical protein
MNESGIFYSRLPTPHFQVSHPRAVAHNEKNENSSSPTPHTLHPIFKKVEGKGQKIYYWYVVIRAVKSVLIFMATAISHLKLNGTDLRMVGSAHPTNFQGFELSLEAYFSDIPATFKLWFL